MQAKQYDYIFLGAGCASLSIVMRLIASNKFSEKKILLIDREPKFRNDRTWCFWQNEPDFFDDIVYHKWSELIFKTSNENSISLDMGNYHYKMIRGIDFYEKCFAAIKLQKNIDIVYGEISFNNSKNNTSTIINLNDKPLITDNNSILFNSLYIPSKKEKGKFYLLQHFKGWIIETKVPIFNPNEAVLMDFSVPQDHGTTFAYILPLSPEKALVEYTLFSKNLLNAAQYNFELNRYIENLTGPNSFNLVEEEFGIIPMTNQSFPLFKDGIYFIGTAGGQTKASTGYTFSFIQKQAEEIVNELISAGTVKRIKKIKKRFSFYDSTLLHVLSNNLLAGKTIFSALFQKNSAALIFKFLDNETTISEELKLLNSLPKKSFLKAGSIEFFKMIFNRKKS